MPKSLEDTREAQGLASPPGSWALRWEHTKCTYSKNSMSSSFRSMSSEVPVFSCLTSPKTLFCIMNSKTISVEHALFKKNIINSLKCHIMYFDCIYPPLLLSVTLGIESFDMCH